MAPMVLRTSRARVAGYFVLALLFTAAGIWMISIGERSGWIALAFFGVGSLLLLVMLVRPSTLELRPDSITYGNAFRSTTIARSEIAEFGLWRIRVTRVGIKRVGKHGSGLTGFDDSLPDNFGRKPDELVSLLENWRISGETTYAQPQTRT